jgi:hypothetical protein
MQVPRREYALTNKKDKRGLINSQGKEKSTMTLTDA